MRYWHFTNYSTVLCPSWGGNKNPSNRKCSRKSITSLPLPLPSLLHPSLPFHSPHSPPSFPSTSLPISLPLSHQFPLPLFLLSKHNVISLYVRLKEELERQMTVSPRSFESVLWCPKSLNFPPSERCTKLKTRLIWPSWPVFLTLWLVHVRLSSFRTSRNPVDAFKLSWTMLYFLTCFGQGIQRTLVNTNLR